MSERPIGIQHGYRHNCGTCGGSTSITAQQETVHAPRVDDPCPSCEDLVEAAAEIGLRVKAREERIGDSWGVVWRWTS